MTTYQGEPLRGGATGQCTTHPASQPCSGLQADGIREGICSFKEFILINSQKPITVTIEVRNCRELVTKIKRKKASGMYDTCLCGLDGLGLWGIILVNTFLFRFVSYTYKGVNYKLVATIERAEFMRRASKEVTDSIILEAIVRSGACEDGPRQLRSSWKSNLLKQKILCTCTGTGKSKKSLPKLTKPTD